jgi:predicted permease
MAQAQTEIRTLVNLFRQSFPYPMARDWNSSATAIPLQQDMVSDIRAKLLILLSSAGVMLLIACANVASLLLSRASARRKEMALRVALGSGRTRIMGQLLTESSLLALLGGGLGILLGASALSIFKAVLPASTPGLDVAGIDWKVAAGTALLALLCGVAFGFAPALSASQVDLASSIRTGGQRATTTVWVRLRGWLIGAEVALTVVLVVSAGLLMRSLYTLSEAHLGFEPSNILTVRISPNPAACAQRAVCIALYERLVTAARGIRGVEHAAVANAVPLDGAMPTIAVDVEGHPKSADYPAPVLWAGAVSPGYLKLMNIPLIDGKAFSESDTTDAGAVVLVTRATAAHFWPGENAIGKHIKEAGEQRWRTVIGIVGDVRQYTLGKNLPDGIPGAIYMPYPQSVRSTKDGAAQIYAAMTLLVKVRGDVSRVAAELRNLAERQDPDVPVGRVETLPDLVAASVADFRSTIRVFLCFSAAALLLAGIGIYGLVSYWVTQRTFEIGVRSALGAARSGIVSLVLKQGLRVALGGIVAGVAVALGVTRFLESMLYGVEATDTLSFAGVTALVLAVTIAATAYPAWRASRIDPGKSLRAD